MFPPPEILGFRLNWFELITVLSMILTLVFGRYFFYIKYKNAKFIDYIFPLATLLLVGYFATYLMAYIEGLTYYLVKKDDKFLIQFGAHKKFLGFIFTIFVATLLNLNIFKSKKLLKVNDFLAVIVCFFIMLEANACLFDGHGCYGRFTNLPWGMYFLHGSAPTLFPVHPTPLYITISHAILFVILLILSNKNLLKGKLILILLVGTSFLNLLIEFFKDNESLFLSLNFSQITYLMIGFISLTIFFNSKKLQA